jgi:hypothetical protein
MEYGYQHPGSQTRRVMYPAAVPQPVDYGYSQKLPSFYPPENHSPYSPTETPSGLRSEPWSVPNRSATSNSSVEAETKPDPGSVVADDVTVGVGVGPKLNQNGIMHVVTTAEVVPSLEAPVVPTNDEQEDGLSSLSDYLLSLFSSTDYTDWSLQVTSPQDLFPWTQIHVHGLLAARSPFLDYQMKTHYEHPRGVSIIVLNTSHRFLRPSSLRVAIHRLYGEPLLQKDALAQHTMAQNSDGIFSSPLKARLEFALGYSVAGNLLQLPGVERRGLHLAAEMLDWSTVETALSFELTGDVKFWVKNLDETGRNSTPSGVSQRSSSMTDTDRSYHRGQEHHPHDQRRLLEIASGPLAGAPFANEVSKAALDFLILNFPTDFQVDTSAQPLEIPDRLPLVTEPIPAKARLSSLRFGSFLSEDEIRFSKESRIISRILLTVPYEMLEAILSRLEGKISKVVAMQVVEEREKRRLRVLNSKASLDERRVRDADWFAVGWEESIKEKDGDGFELTRTPKGLQDSADGQVS